jgi:phosphoribosylformylglycinamidine synthase
MTFWKEHASVDDAIRAGLTAEEFSGILTLVGRPLSVLEVGIFAALYSEHCSYKSTKVHLRNLPTEGPRVVHGPGENAGVVDIGDDQVVVFKIESHNHPSFIEPFQGAATGVGGILRDVFTMGARPLALMNALRFGSLGLVPGANRPEQEGVSQSVVARNRYLLRQAVAGIGHYGNCVGVPTVGGELYFHSSYDGNCLVNAFALGLTTKDKIFLGQASGVGNIVMYVGSKTGRDGIHGATMSSETFDEGSEEKRPTVQVGDPFQEKLLIEACLEVMDRGIILGIQDMGAAGMTSSSYEIADRGDVGLCLHLDRVPQRESNMNPYEIMLSESQERMLVVVERGGEEEVAQVFNRWGLDAVAIGEVTDTKLVELFWHGERVSSLAPSALTRSAPQYRWPEEPPPDYRARLEFDVDSFAPPSDISAAWLQLLGHENACSRRRVFEQYDSTVRTNTVIHPGGDAAVIRVKSSRGTEKGIAMTLDCNSRFCALDPRLGSALSVVEAMRNLTAVGAIPIGLSDCLNFGSPQRPESMWQIAESIRGIGDAARALEIPVVSGNVSLNNETRGKAILPTPQIAMVGLMDDASKAVTIHFKSEGDIVFMVGATQPKDLGGSEYLEVSTGLVRGTPPLLDYDLEARTARTIVGLIADGLLESCHDISQGGLAAALAESCFGPKGTVGVRLELSLEGSGQPEEGARHGYLFSETGSRFLISASSKYADVVQRTLHDAGLVIGGKGVVGGNWISVEGVARIDVAEAFQVWKKGLDSVFGT